MLKLTLSSLSLTLSLAAACVPQSSDEPVLGEAELGAQDREVVATALGATLAKQYAPENGVAQITTDCALGAPPVWLAPVEGGVMVGNLLGLSWEVDGSCLDASGAPMVVCDGSTDQADFTVNLEGSLSLFGWTGRLGVTVSSHADDLQSAVVTVSGDTEVELESQFDEWGRPITHLATFTISTSGSATIDRVSRVALAGQGQVSITYVRTRSDQGQVGSWELSIGASIEGGFATVDIGGESFRIDLRTGAIVRV